MEPDRMSLQTVSARVQVLLRGWEAVADERHSTARPWPGCAATIAQNSSARSASGASWTDRDRVTAVARWFAERALDYAGASPLIERHAAEQAAAEIEAGCRMNARRDTAADGGVS
jgi:hypothetical protein